MVSLKEVDELLKKCAYELGMDYEPESYESKETDEQKQMKEIKEWLKESPNTFTDTLNSYGINLK